MGRALTVFIHVLLFGVLVWVCLGHRADIEYEVAANANSALTAGGFDFARASASGQQVTLRGTATTPALRQAAEQAVLAARGVGSVDNQIVLLADVPPPGPDSSPMALPPDTMAASATDTPVSRESLKTGTTVDAAPTAQTDSAAAIPVEPIPESLQVLLDGQGKRAEVAGLLLNPKLAADRRDELAALISAALPGWRVNSGMRPNANVPNDLGAVISKVLPALAVADSARLDADQQGIRVAAELANFADRSALEKVLAELEQAEFAERGLSWALDSPPPRVPSKVDGCQRSFDDLLGKDAILFTTNLADIRETSLPLMNKLAEVARECNLSIEIGGHTDSRGSVELNNALSQARADSVRDYLIAQGVDGERISARGYGAMRPIADNNTVNGRQINRRIEFSVKRTD